MADTEMPDVPTAASSSKVVTQQIKPEAKDGGAVKKRFEVKKVCNEMAIHYQ